MRAMRVQLCAYGEMPKLGELGQCKTKSVFEQTCVIVTTPPCFVSLQLALMGGAPMTKGGCSHGFALFGFSFSPCFCAGRE